MSLSVSRISFRRAATVLAGVTLCASAVHAAGPYELSAVPTLPGDTRNFALDINNNRQVSGNSGMAAGSTLKPYLATGSTVIALGSVVSNQPFGRGYAVNDSGIVVGETDLNSNKAFVWDSTNGIRPLLTIAGTQGGVAHDINNGGFAVGISSNGTASKPTLYTPGLNGTYSASDLGTLAGTATSTGRAWAINQSGVAAGLSTNAAGTSQATMWNNGTITNLTSLGDGTRFSQAYGINDNNVAVGASSTGQTVGQLIGTTSTTSITRAFVAADGTITELAPFNLFTPTNNGATTNYHSIAQDINDAGLIVGNSQRVSGTAAIATLWENGVPIDLNTFLPANSGWVLQSAEGINAAGDITGFGTFDGNTRAFVLAIPEPTSLGLVGLAAIGLMCRQRWSE